MIEQAVVLATGHGVRLGSLIKDRSKAMMPVLGRPIVVRIMDRLYEAGIRQFILIVGENEGEVVSYLNTSWMPDVTIQIVLQSSSRSAAEALGSAASYINGPFLLASAYVLTPPGHVAALIKRFNDTKADLVVSLAPGNPTATVNFNAQLANTRMDGLRVLEITDTPPTGRHALGAFLLYACGKRLLNHCIGGTRTDREMVGAVQGLLKSGAKVGGVAAEWFMPLTAELDLLAINKRLLREGRDTHILSELPGSIHITPPVRIDPRVSIGPNAKIGPNVYLESGASIGQDAVIWDSVVLRNAAIADKEVIHGQIVGSRARISEIPAAELE